MNKKLDSYQKNFMFIVALVIIQNILNLKTLEIAYSEIILITIILFLGGLVAVGLWMIADKIFSSFESGEDSVSLKSRVFHNVIATIICISWLLFEHLAVYYNFGKLAVMDVSFYETLLVYAIAIGIVAGLTVVWHKMKKKHDGCSE